MSFIRYRGGVYVGNSKHYDFLVFCGKGAIVASSSIRLHNIEY